MRSTKMLFLIFSMALIGSDSFAASLVTCDGQSNSRLLEAAVQDMNSTQPEGLVSIGRGLVSLTGLDLSRQAAQAVFSSLENYNPNFNPSALKLNVQLIGCKTEDIQ